jgi:hypothetical protein
MKDVRFFRKDEEPTAKGLAQDDLLRLKTEIL